MHLFTLLRFLTPIEKKRWTLNLLTHWLTPSDIRLNAKLSNEMKSVCVFYGENKGSQTSFASFLLISVEEESMLGVESAEIRAVLVLEIV